MQTIESACWYCGAAAGESCQKPFDDAHCRRASQHTGAEPVAKVTEQEFDYPWRTKIAPFGLSVDQCQARLPVGTLLYLAAPPPEGPAVAALMPEIGDYVLATKFSDGDPGDPWALGFYTGTDTLGSSVRYMVKDGAGKNIRGNGYRRIGRITTEIGRWLWENRDNLERAPSKINLWAMYDWVYVNEMVLDAARKALSGSPETQAGEPR